MSNRIGEAAQKAYEDGYQAAMADVRRVMEDGGDFATVQEWVGGSGTPTVEYDVERCPCCRAAMRGSDHCPDCGCEEYESYCEMGGH